MSVTDLAMHHPDPITLFAMTPGELLEKYLKREKIQKADFGRMVGSDYQKANRWTQDIGFGPKNRRKAAEVLGLPHDYFDRPDDDDAMREREATRRRVFKDFQETDIAKRIAKADPSVMAALDATPIPPGRVPTVDFYMGLALVFTGQLTPQQASESLDWNERESRAIETKRTDPARKD